MAFPGRYFTFSNILNRLMMMFVQYIVRPKLTRHMSASWSSHNLSPTLPSKFGMLLGGRGSSLYHDIADQGAQGTREVKKLSKHRETAADHMQMKRTSERV